MDFSQKPIKIFFSYYKPHMALFLLDMFFALVYACIDLFFPLVSRYTLTKMLPQGAYKAFFILIAVLVLVYLLRSFAFWIVTYLGHKFGLCVETDMRRDAFSHIENQSYEFFDKNRTGHLMSSVTYDLFDITELAHHGPENILISVVTFVGSFFIMLHIRWELSVAVFAVVPFMLLFTMKSRYDMKQTQRRVKEKTAHINSEIESSISGIRVTKVFTNEEYEKQRFAESNKLYFDSKVTTHRAFADFHFSIEFFTHILYVVVLGVGGYLIMKEKMTIPDIVAANLFVSAFLQPVRRLANFSEQLSTGSAGFSRFIKLMQTHEETFEKTDAVELTKNEAINGDIVFSEVSFSYNEKQNVLSGVNLTVPAGKTYALVGPSGGGKTTLCHLLPRFYDINSGSITIAGRDIRDFKIKSLRSQIGIVQQDVFLFAGTVRENIAYGRPDAGFDEIVEAAKRSEIHEDIMKMPDGYDTIVGERGIRLSGGQKQRISIARIFLKNPPILILDEATSALDTETEIKIQKSFDELIKGRTTFVIAHRLSTIKNADSIVVVSDEGISETGTHAALLASGGIYKNLYEAQYGLV
jgi:ATP-binding cassette subfamily B protein